MKIFILDLWIGLLIFPYEEPKKQKNEKQKNEKQKEKKKQKKNCLFNCIRSQISILNCSIILISILILLSSVPIFTAIY
jgi:hypothetical protein